ncbi:hypothetical protein CN692_04655 [Bacillus sp. AFS002410]|uniref:O-antigen ligase family protein n=1 Tax=Bacillus sp. AFS002410 TaxID=2033481 RepID=UPI000BF1F289|nr:O-antigen ligase family protein [Bacillus sp. AFS002410]PEJ59489.1 hypothetical protein CN692_04655 [Bacillus sp. AFS002410]
MIIILILSNKHKIELLIKIFYCLLILMPLIDFVNGLLINIGGPQIIGMFYRGFFIIFILVSLSIFYKYNDQGLLKIYIASFLLFFVLFIQTFFLHGNPYFFTSDISVVLKLLLSMYIIEFSKKFIKGKSKKNYFNKILFIYSIIFPVLLLIPYFLGLGTSTYNNGGGYKGFFSATNDITIVFLLLNIFMGSTFFQSITNRKKYILNGIVYFANFSSLILIGTKTGILFGIICFLFLYIKTVFFNKKASVVNRIKVLVITILILFLSIYIFKNIFIEPLLNTYERFLYFYNLYSGNLIQFISSSRSIFLGEAYMRLDEEPMKIIRFIFGSGFKYRIQNWGNGDLVEMDMFDTFFSLGIIGIGIVLISYFQYFLLSVKRTIGIYSVSFWILILYSFFAGHVLYSALSSTLLGIVCAQLVCKKDQERG